MIRRWSNGKDGAIDVTVTSPLASSNVAGAAAEAGASLTKACMRKTRDTADACRREGLVFLPFALETLGGFHSGAVTQVKLQPWLGAGALKRERQPANCSGGCRSTSCGAMP